MEYLLGAAQALVVIAVLWVKISDLGRRVDRLERRVDGFLNHGRKR
jgi:hypothetical protein